jgi:hypothetical protein|nr:MAG TPA: replisome organizer [Caudoviricetes sp.]
MARIRTIKPKFWDDSKIGKISRDSRLLYIGLWTFSDDVGVVIGDNIWLKSKIFPYDQIQVQQFEKWLSELATNGFICQFSYKNENFIYLPNFARHQVINRPNIDDLNIPKNQLNNILSKFTDKSLINHGTFTDQSVPIEEEEKEKDNNIGDSNESLVCGTSQPHAERIDYSELVKFFNEETKGVFGTVRTPLSVTRKGMINARIKVYGKNMFADMIRRAYQSDFLKGQNKKGWRASFDWLIKPTNFEKVISGNYDNKHRTNNNTGERDMEEFYRSIASGIARQSYEETKR